MAYETIVYEPGTVARVTLDRPEKKNAQSWRLLREMEHAFGAAVADPECRVIVLSGAGESFSAGHDLDSPEQLAEMEERLEPLDGFARSELYRDIYIDSHLRWRDLTKPTIAMVHGYCIFGGWMIAAAMDVIFAADDARFIPTYGDYFSVPWDVGARKAKEILFGQTFLTAEQARDAGLVNRVVPRAELEEHTLRYAYRVAENDPFYNRRVKHAVNQAQDVQGFSTAIRTLHPDFNNRRFGGDRPARMSGDDPFRDMVARAVRYAREDGLLPERAPRPTDERD